MLKVRGDTVELLILDRIYEDLAAVFEERFRDWREEDHEASRLLGRMMGLGDS